MLIPLLLLLLANFAGATSALFIKGCAVEPIALSGWRLVLAALLLSPLFARDWRRHRETFAWKKLACCLLPGAGLAVHFILWAMAVPRTTAVNSTLVVNMVPIAMPFFLWGFVRERLTRAEWIGTALSLVGLCVLGAGDLHLGRDTFLGDALAFASMLVFCGYMILARQNRDFPSIFLYVPPLYLAGGALCLMASAACETPFQAYARQDWLMLLGLALVPTVVGHSLFNWAMQHLRGQFVSITTLSQCVFAGVLAYPLLGEVPSAAFYAAAALMALGMAVALLSPAPPAALATATTSTSGS